MTVRSLAVRTMLLVALSTPRLAVAQQPPQDPTQFDMLGFIESATLDASCLDDVRCGGTITISGQRIVVPRNTILQMPATALPWRDVFARAPFPYGLSALPSPMTGLALDDVPAPPMTFEAHVIGNRVGDTYVAGLVYLAQHSLQSSQGFINFIDVGTGFFEVGGVIGSSGTGQRVKLNDPIGRFSRAWTPDERFTVDEDNPTVRSDTGYPMCIPRAADDAFCPQANRPPDPASPSGFKMIFQMPRVDQVVAGGPDPRLMAPFEVGDFVTYSGILVEDAPGAGTFHVAAFSLLGNVGIFTAPGADPAYVAVDVTLLGVGGVTVAGLTEATARTRFEGFTTDPTRTIDLFAVDLDPCTGLEPATLRDWGASTVDPGPPAGAVAGRWRFRPPSKVLFMPSGGAFLPATRDVRAAIHGAAIVELPDAALAAVADPRISGVYQAPISEFLFPENAGAGTPIVANNFQDMPFLALGSGKIDPAGPIYGQLAPWPGMPIPAAASCVVSGTPIANPGAGQIVASGALVTLDGTASTDGGAPPLTYAWTQTGGTPVALSSTTAPAPTFTAPTVLPGPAATLTFSLVVTNASLVASAPASVSVVVNPIVSDLVTISLVEYRVAKQRLTVNAGSTDAPDAILTAQAFDASGVAQGPAQTMTFSGGVYLIDLVGVPQPATVKVVSTHGGSATSGITRLR